LYRKVERYRIVIEDYKRIIEDERIQALNNQQVIDLKVELD
jgi:hypothetical protein